MEHANSNDLFKEYKLAKHNVQLMEAILVSLQTKRNEEDFGAELTFAMNFSYRFELISETTAYGFLRTMMQGRDRKTEEERCEFFVEHRGTFECREPLSPDDFRQFLDIQVVPQLLPYARTTISQVSGWFDIPTVNLPTMDIIQSLLENEQES